MEDRGYELLGYFELAVLYVCLGIGSLFSTPIFNKMGGP